MPELDPLIEACLAEIARAQDDAARFDVASRNRRQLLGDPEIARRLVDRAIAAESPDPAEPTLQLLERCLDEARMDVTGRGFQPSRLRGADGAAARRGTRRRRKRRSERARRAR